MRSHDRQENYVLNCAAWEKQDRKAAEKATKKAARQSDEIAGNQDNYIAKINGEDNQVPFDELDELFEDNPQLISAWYCNDVRNPANYVECFKRLRFLNQSLKTHGRLSERDEILRRLLTMNMSPDNLWGAERCVFLGEREESVREMGHYLNALGGWHLMQSVLTDTYKGDWATLDRAWNGIGEWLT